MESGLNDILERINSKLHAFTNFPSSEGATPKPPSKITNTSTAYYIDRKQDRQRPKLLPTHQSHVSHNILKVCQHNTSIMEESFNWGSSNKNNGSSQENVRTFKSNQLMEQLQKNQNAKNSNTNIHEQNYLSLRKRNKALENDVKKLQQRLQMIQKSLSKDDKQTNSASGNISLPTKARKIENNHTKSSNLQLPQKKISNPEKYSTKKSTFSQNSIKQQGKSFNKVSVLKHNDPSKNILKNFSKNCSLNYSRKNVHKNQETKVGIRQNSEVNLGIPEKKLGKGSKQKSSVNVSKTLLRCKSSQALNQQQEDRHQFSHSRQGKQKSKGKRDQLIGSQYSYLSPMQKNNFKDNSKGDKTKFDKTTIPKQSKLNKVGLRRSIKWD